MCRLVLVCIRLGTSQLFISSVGMWLSASTAEHDTLCSTFMTSPLSVSPGRSSNILVVVIEVRMESDCESVTASPKLPPDRITCIIDSPDLYTNLHERAQVVSYITSNVASLS